MSSIAAWINGSNIPDGERLGVLSGTGPFFVPHSSTAFSAGEWLLTGEIRVAGRLAESIVDGPGLRYVLFTQGCPHHCPGCHNPETHDFQSGVTVPLATVHQEILKNPLLRGVTFSGGEPFRQWKELLPLASTLKAQGYHLLAYTGYVFEELADWSLPFLSLLDMLVDGPFLLAEKSLELRFRGSRNQRILDVPASLHQGRAVLSQKYN